MDYRLTDKRYIEDLHCEVSIYSHIKTGATVVVMPAEDKNKAISIAFSTPSENSRGIAHIIEHSVLCGSSKYPLKDPFVQLMKGSMYSFLNAMTFSDFTVYPVASTNDRDFKNLADVYLDAVFNPLLPGKKEIFLQEGWHYALDDNGGVESYNGVVFNEMRGLGASADFHLENAVSRALFKDSPYQYESGGLPLDIADLSFEELADFYRRHYTASNCFIFLYGNIDSDEMLDYISSGYLNKYEAGESYRVPRIDKTAFDSELCANYPVSEEEAEKGYYYSYAFALPIEHNPLNVLTLRVLDRVLCSSQGAYIKKAIQDKKIGEDFHADVDELISCPVFSFVSLLCYEKDGKTVKDIIDSELESVVKNGIDKKRLISAIDMLEFQEREAADTWAPKGIMYAIDLLPKFLYGEDNPLEMLEWFAAVGRLRKLAEGDYFESFIKEHFLDNTHKSFVTLKPDVTFTERAEKALEEKCLATAAKADTAQIKKDFELLNAYRNSEDTPENIEKIPLLERSDLSAEPPLTPSQKIALDGGELLYQKKQTNGIAYFDWYFDLRSLGSELLPYYRIFTELFGAMDTKEHSYAELSDLIDSKTGEISHRLFIAKSTPQSVSAVPYMVWHSRFLCSKADEAFALNREILLDTDFSDTNRIHDMLLQLKASMARTYQNSAHLSVVSYGIAQHSDKFAWTEQLKGYTFYKRLCDILDSFDGEKDGIVKAMNGIRKALLNRSSWKLSFVGTEDFLPEAKRLSESFIALLDGENTVKPAAVDIPAKRNTAIYSQSQVQYDGLCGILSDDAVDRRGNILVLMHLLNTDYLWHNIRVLGGAYGAFVLSEYSGEFAMVSYRDPKLDETYACYRGVTDYLSSLDMSDRDMRQFVIGAMNKLDYPLMPYLEGSLEVKNELCGIGTDEVKRIRQQIITTSTEDIKALIPYLDGWLSGATETVIGNEQTIRSSSLSFDEISALRK